MFYADRVTGSMQRAMEETARRRTLQSAYNTEHGITARSVVKSVDQVRFITRVADARVAREERAARRAGDGAPTVDRAALIARLEREMQEAATALDFETAARIRDELFDIRAQSGRQSAGAAASTGTTGRRRGMTIAADN